MKRLLFIFMLISHLSYGGYRADILGDGYQQLTLVMEDDYEGDVEATLIRCAPIAPSTRAVLYIHGFNDYFFQTEMAERFRDSLYNFYAIDLRKYGRSLLDHQRPYNVRDVREYFEELDMAIDIIRSEGSKQIFLMGHSTGGLTASLYANERKIDGLILNSPFLDMNMGWTIETLGAPIVWMYGRLYPNKSITTAESSAYGKSLHKDYYGEWDFDTNWKIISHSNFSLGWLSAILTAQNAVQRDVHIECPIFLAYSAKSIYRLRFHEDCHTGDAVLDVKDIEKYGGQLGDDVTHLKLEGALHDVVLSRAEVRNRFYEELFRWLKCI
ncbi:MAG: alpha/beta hydrolase [Rikenellaceae bacterium]